MRKIFFLFCFGFLFTFYAKAQKVTGKSEELIKKINNQFTPETTGGKLISFAKTMIGVPYRYASNNPSIGFDCSGFVSYVFRNFGFKVPRSSREFNLAGSPIKLENAKVGDILVFTGSNAKRRVVGHVGIIADIEEGKISFIHSSSGKAKGVTISTLDAHYRSRLLRAVSIL